MKKRTRRLSLVRETIGNLEDHNLRRIGGAGTSDECIAPSICECESVGCGGTGSFCPTMTICSNCV
ncbi:MAG TPA: hypothetical protein VLE27_08600 [Thermoanaerobaculia bacterium]|nr:hypothetical protein [Thermoanaerobaculia bacterium]